MTTMPKATPPSVAREASTARPAAAAAAIGRQNQLTLATLTDARRAILYGALGMLALLVAGSDEMMATGGGTLAWIVLLAASFAAVWRIWIDAHSY